jgi:nicotinate-nucleotide pyrophosphorylase (carboxylating)
MNSLIPTWKHFIALGLQEDSVAFDWTTRSVQKANPKQSITAATLIAKSAGIWAGEVGLKALALVSRELGSPLEIKSFAKDGDLLAPQQKISEWVGEPEAILTFERTFINLASYTSGMATQTHELVEKITNAAKSAGIQKTPRLAPTRKTIPGFRDLAIQSTLIGGASPHRFNLSGGLLLKENHIAAAGGITAAIKSARSVAPHLLKIEIEVRNETELKEAIQAGAEVILLDNFSPAQIKTAMRLKPRDGVLYEASGGIHSENISSYVIEGVDVISVGSITHSVKALDLSLLMNSIK